MIVIILNFVYTKCLILTSDNNWRVIMFVSRLDLDWTALNPEFFQQFLVCFTINNIITLTKAASILKTTVTPHYTTATTITTTRTTRTTTNTITTNILHNIVVGFNLKLLFLINWQHFSKKIMPHFRITWYSAYLSISCVVYHMCYSGF